MAHRRKEDTTLAQQLMTGLYFKGEDVDSRTQWSPMKRSICLEELIPSTGGSFGGNDVDKEVLLFFQEVCGNETMKRFKNENIDDYMNLLQKLEVAKRQVDVTKKNPIQLTVPLSLLNLVKEDKTKKNLKNALSASKYSENISLQGSNKLKFSNGSFEIFFLNTVNGIIKSLAEVFEETPGIKMDSIVLVGGLSECNALITAVKGRFPDKKIIVPEEAGLSVLKGAVYFGHNPAAVTKRVSRYTYGIRGKRRSEFQELLKKGEQVERGMTKAWVDRVEIQGNETFEREIFVSEANEVRSIDEIGCKCLGTLRIPLYNMAVGTKLNITGFLEVGLTELRIKARYKASGIEHEVMFEILD